MLHAVIMAGGAGTRFWPASRTTRPKQLLNLAGDRSMLQATVDRLTGLVNPQQILIVTNKALVAPMAEQLPQLPRGAILGEPCKRDTAPCVGLAAGIVARHDPDAVMVVLPADHVIHPADVFQRSVRAAVELVERQPELLVTFGIQPTYAATGYGYIERGELLPADIQPTQGAPRAYAVRTFREKPTVSVAQQYLAAGTYYWNAGIFVWKAATILAALRQFEPQIMQHVDAIVRQVDGPEFQQTFEKEFAEIDGKSVDFAVMERYPHVAVLPAEFQWDDVGNWQSLARTRGTDENGNTIVGRHLGIQTSQSIIRSEGNHLIVTLGVEGLIIVHTPDATLVARKDDEEALRQIVPKLREMGWDDVL